MLWSSLLDESMRGVSEVCDEGVKLQPRIGTVKSHEEPIQRRHRLALTGRPDAVVLGSNAFFAAVISRQIIPGSMG